MTMNQWPPIAPDTTQNTPYSSFFLSQLGQAALLSIVHALLVVIAVCGSRFYRSNPAKYGCGDGIRTKEIFHRECHRICLAAAHIALHYSLYIVSENWARGRRGIELHRRFVSTWLPWVYSAGDWNLRCTSEEFLFRLFAIPYLLRMTK